MLKMSNGGYPNYPPAYSAQPPQCSTDPYTAQPNYCYQQQPYPSPPPAYSAPQGQYGVQQQQQYGVPNQMYNVTPNLPQSSNTIYPRLPPPVPPPPQLPAGYQPTNTGFNATAQGYTQSSSADQTGNATIGFQPQGYAPPRPAPPPPASSVGFGVLPDGSAATHGSAAGPAPSYPAGGTAQTGGGYPTSPGTQWQDTPLPPGLKEVWQCGSNTQVFFLQHDDRVVSLNNDMFITVFLNTEFDFNRCPSRRSSLSCSSNRNSPSRSSLQPPEVTEPSQQFSVLVECPGVFRVKLSPVRGHVFVTSARDYLAMIDQGTKPSRSVIVALPKDLDQTHLQNLLSFLEENASLTTDNDGVVTTVSSTVESAFNYSSKLGSNLIKDSAPSLFKSTKNLRKGTGALVRLGGNLMSKGASLVAETVSPTSKEEKILQFDPLVNQLKASVAMLRESVVQGAVTVVSRPRGL